MGEFLEDRVFTLEVQDHPHVVILRCTGRIMRGAGADALRQAVMGQGQHRLVIELSGVESMDAGGLGLLVELHNWAQARHQSMQLVNPTGRVRQLLEMTRLHAVLQISPTPQNCDEAA